VSRSKRCRIQRITKAGVAKVAEVQSTRRVAEVREQLLRTALDMLMTEGPMVVHRFLKVNNVMTATSPSVNRDTAYRAFPGEFDMIRACSAMANDLDYNGVNATLSEVVSAYVDSYDSVRDRLIATLEANVIGSADSPGWPLGFLMHAIAITASHRWNGPKPTNPEFLALARALLEDRRRLYDGMTDIYEPFLRRMMADVGLRPAGGRTTRDVVRLTNCLIDGAVLRMFIDPTFEARDVAEALLRFGMSLDDWLQGVRALRAIIHH
jgi:hypothetical protein